MQRNRRAALIRVGRSKDSHHWSTLVMTQALQLVEEPGGQRVRAGVYGLNAYALHVAQSDGDCWHAEVVHGTVLEAGRAGGEMVPALVLHRCHGDSPPGEPGAPQLRQLLAARY